MILNVDGMSFSYGDTEIIDDMGLFADKGDMVSILGPNGVGKTTFLKCINRICRPACGITEIDGEDIESVSRNDLAKKIGYVPQSAEIGPARVFDSVLLGRKPYIGYSVSDADIQLTGKVIDLLGLSKLSEKRMDQISGGERQMVQIARAIVQHPRVILLDEPTNNLDPRNQHLVMKTVANLVKRYDMCAVMTNHDINLSLRYCNKFMLMKSGKVYVAGGASIVTPDTIREVYGIEATVEHIRGIPVVVPL